MADRITRWPINLYLGEDWHRVLFWEQGEGSPLHISTFKLDFYDKMDSITSSLSLTELSTGINIDSLGGVLEITIPWSRWSSLLWERGYHRFYINGDLMLNGPVIKLAT